MCAAACPFIGVHGAERHVAFPDHPRFAVQRLEDQFGLGAVTVTSMGQDRQGFLWIGTQTGLYRYDGARAKKLPEVESIVGHYITDLLIAPDGTVWIAGSHGIAHYKNGHFERLPIPLSAMPLASGNQNFAIDSSGVAYVLAFRRGVLRIDPARPEKALLLGKPENMGDGTAGIVRAVDDSIWFTYGKRLAHLSAGSDEIVIDSSIRLPDDRVVALLFDGMQELWLRTASHLLRLDTWGHKVVPETEVAGTANEEEGKPSVDARGKLLVPSSTGLYWQEGGRWRLLTDRLGLASNDIQSALEDKEGTLWVAGSGTGLDRLPGVHEWSAWTTAEGLPDNSTWATLRDREGRLWVSTARGIGVWDHNARRWIVPGTLSSGTAHGIRQIQLARDGAVWGLTSAGRLIRIDPNNFSTSQIPGFHGRPFVTVLASPKGDIWATTRARLVRFDGAKGLSEPHEVVLPPGENQDLEYMGFSPSGTLWATGRGTLYRFDGNTWRRFTAADGLQGLTLTSVVSPNDNEVWIAYNDVVKVTHVKLDAHGVASMEHHDWDWTIIGHDSQNRIWFNGTEGIVVLSPDGHMQRMNHSLWFFPRMGTCSA